MAQAERRLYALLFHPEVVHTQSGLEILRNFAYGVCGCTGDWTMRSFVQEATDRIRAQVGDGRVVCGLSGGVDSTVAAVLIHRAIGDRLTCIFVDNGVITECSASNIFIVKNEIVRTHPVGDKVLPGVTRVLLLRIASEMGIQLVEGPTDLTEAQAADEVFITSTTREISWVSQWDEREISPTCGPITRRLHEALRGMISKAISQAA
jgi:branched-subunit amino acid aminotransferase/4-amino-4-deoxychorismate lyase